MTSPGTHTALLLFTRTTRAEARAKDLSGKHSLHVSSQIADHLIGHADRTARASGLPCFVIDSDHQQGDSFGEKLANAFEAIYALGYNGVIAIGNDCPALTSGDLREAGQVLEQQYAVIGPAHDGGVYLIGLQHDAYDRTQFLSLPWSTEHLTAAFCTQMQQENVAFHICTLRSDIDTAEQLLHLLYNHPVCHTLRMAIRSVLASLSPKVNSLLYDPINSGSRNAIGLRAPPAC